MKTKIFGLVLSMLVFFICGCGTLFNLAGLSENRNELEKYVQKQEGLFIKLKNDVVANRLKKGIVKDKVLSLYGEPLFCQYVDGQEGIKEYCSYRHPTKYFSSDIINLKFDKDNKLYSWELEPGAQN